MSFVKFYSNHYKLHYGISTNLQDYHNLGYKYSYKCKFCGRKGKKFFNYKSHTIPKSIGNEFLISSFECDVCNERFGKFESSLSNYFGIVRSFIHPQTAKGKRRIPKYKHPNTNAEIYSSNNWIVAKDKEKNFLKDKNDRQSTINAIKNPYIPINIYKSLLKIFLSILDGRSLKSFGRILDFVNDDSVEIKDVRIYQLAKLFTIEHGFDMGFWDFPSIFLFKKNKKIKDLPTFTMILCAYNKILQIFPFYEHDDPIYNSEVKLARILPLFSEDNKGREIFIRDIDLRIDKKIENEQDSLIFTSLVEPITKYYTEEEHQLLLKKMGISDN